MEERGEDVLEKIFTALYLQEHLGIWGGGLIIWVQSRVIGGKSVTENKE